MIDFWIFPLSTIWGAYHLCGFQRSENGMKQQFHRKLKTKKEAEKYVLSDHINIKYENVRG